MEDTLKKFIYTGLGLLSLTTSRIRETIDELINNRKITEEEGRRIIDDFAGMAKHHTADFEQQIETISLKYGKDFSFSAEEEIEMLKQRVAALESRLNYSDNEADSKAKPANEGKKISFLKHQQRKSEAMQLNSGPVEKVEDNERVSLGDKVLTPERKMEAERNRMQNQSDRPSQRRVEKDTQKATLDQPVLTPGKKVEQDMKDAEKES